VIRDFPLPSFDTMIAQCRPQLERLRHILHLPAEQAVAPCSANAGPAVQLIRLVGNLPLRSLEEEGEPGCLASHLLQLAATSARLYQERHPEPPRGARDRADWCRRLTAICLAGLLRDIGILWYVDVRAGSHEWPIHRALIDWSFEIARADPRITSLQLRTRAAPRDALAGLRLPNLYFLSRLVLPAVARSWGWQTANDILGSLSRGGGGGTPREDLLTLVEEARIHDLAERSHDRVIPPLPASPASTATGQRVAEQGDGEAGDGPTGQAALAQAFLLAFRQLMARADAPRINHHEADVLVSPSHTLLALTPARTDGAIAWICEHTPGRGAGQERGRLASGGA
jgi:hypothetical protein